MREALRPQRLDLLAQRGADPLVGVEGEHPVVARGAHREVALGHEARPGRVRDHARARPPRAISRVRSRRAGVHEHDLVAERDARERVADLSLLVLRDQDGRERHHARQYSRAPQGGQILNEAHSRPAARYDLRVTDTAAPLTTDALLRVFEEKAALLQGHFLLSSGLHSPRYLQCARVLMDPALATRLCAELARRLAPHLAGARPGAVVAPALGGVLVAHEVARALGCRALFTERQDGAMTLRRGLHARRRASRWSWSRT